MAPYFIATIRDRQYSSIYFIYLTGSSPQAIYKADLEWLRGIGWMPEGSPEVLRVKNAQEILCDSVYRTPVVKLKYTSIVDTPEVVLAKSNAENISIVSRCCSLCVKTKSKLHVTIKQKIENDKLCWPSIFRKNIDKCKQHE